MSFISIYTTNISELWPRTVVSVSTAWTSQSSAVTIKSVKPASSLRQEEVCQPYVEQDVQPRSQSRCRKCDPCKAEDCAKCGNCLDKAKFGGPNKRKSACVKKNKRPRQLTMGYIKQYSKFANQIVKERQQRKVESYRNDPKAALSGSEIRFEDYPVIPTPAFRSLFGEFEKFKNFYLPRIQSSNPMLPLFALKYLCQVKFREIFSP